MITAQQVINQVREDGYPLTFLSTHKVNMKSGVYFIFDGHELLYVGTTQDIRSRLGNHHVYNPERHTLALIECARRYSCIDIERGYIRLFDPPMNTAYTSRCNMGYATAESRWGFKRGDKPKKERMKELQQLPHPQTSPEEVK